MRLHFAYIFHTEIKDSNPAFFGERRKWEKVKSVGCKWTAAVAQLIKHLTTDPEIKGSNIATFGDRGKWQKDDKHFGLTRPAAVAQLIEHLITYPEIKGSYPATNGNRRKWKKR